MNNTCNQNFYRDFSVDVGSLNRRVRRNPAEAVRLSEENYRYGVSHIASVLQKRMGSCSVVLLAGPSASGKTTTAYKLREQLVDLGIGAHVVSLDDFYKNRDFYPRRKDGSIDYESVYALDIDCLHDCFHRLIVKRQADFPVFDFETVSRKEERRRIKLSDHDILIVEGIHALNPILMPPGDTNSFFRLYASVQTDYQMNGRTLLSRKDIRLMRRMVRDLKFRASPVQATFDMWDQVCEGEERYIKPYRALADAQIDTLHLYEPCVFHHYLLPLCEQELDDAHRKKLHSLCAALEYIEDIGVEMIPANSLLREFVGV